MKFKAEREIHSLIYQLWIVFRWWETKAEIERTILKQKSTREDLIIFYYREEDETNKTDNTENQNLHNNKVKITKEFDEIHIKV